MTKLMEPSQRCLPFGIAINEGIDHDFNERIDEQAKLAVARAKELVRMVEGAVVQSRQKDKVHAIVRGEYLARKFAAAMKSLKLELGDEAKPAPDDLDGDSDKSW